MMDIFCPNACCEVVPFVFIADNLFVDCGDWVFSKNMPWGKVPPTTGGLFQRRHFNLHRRPFLVRSQNFQDILPVHFYPIITGSFHHLSSVRTGTRGRPWHDTCLWRVAWILSETSMSVPSLTIFIGKDLILV